MTQQTLGGEKNQRYTDIAMELPPQHMEEVGRFGAVHHLQVEIGTKSQKPLYAAARVLGTLSLVTMGQHHHKSRLDAPFLLGGSDVLVHDHLSHIDRKST